MKQQFFNLCMILMSAGVYAQVGINNPNPDASAALEVTSVDNNKGFLPPRLTTAQRDAIASPAIGLIIYNTSTNCLNTFVGLGWNENCGTPTYGVIGTLDCAGAITSGLLISGVAVSGVSSSVPYTGGNGFPHSGQIVTSTGVTGLTATLAPGSFALGSGNLTYNISGTPASSGTASFVLNIGGQMCTLQWNGDCTNLNNIPTASIDTLPRGYFKDEVNFINTSTGNITSNLWDFGDGWTTDTDEFSFSHIYAETGTFLVSLVVTNNFGCSDTAQITVVVPVFVQEPRVITPNGDGFNDKFIIPVSGNNEFELIIKNRSGEVVFTSKGARLAWDGTTQSGLSIPQGTYYYILKAVGSKDYSKQGSITLLRE